jgi:BirA family biotin operon repressor/biotin-[acetyl-CoA-carboxylase] ligase
VLDDAQMRAALAPLVVGVVASCASTNAELLAGEGSPALLVADRQTRGRGTRGRRWHSAPGAALLMSLRHPVDRPLRELSGLSLAVGVAVLRALRSLGYTAATLKWPNDILVEGAKLGGILVETRMQGGRVVAVIGCGINWHASPQGLPLRLAAAALADRMRPPPSRSAGAVAIARELLAAIAQFEREGLDAFRGEWESAHAHAGRRVRVRLGGGRVVTGTAEGLEADGSLKLRTRSGLRAVQSGTVRPV